MCLNVLSRAFVVLIVLGLLPTVAAAEWAGDPYLLPNDPVTDEPLAEVEKPVVVSHEGREFRFAKQDSADKFLAAPGDYIPTVDKAMVAQQMPYYPLTKCPIGGKLGSMGKPVDLIYNNRLVRFCCAGCVDNFKEDPAATVAKLDAAAIKAQARLYKGKDAACPVSGEKLGSMGKTIDKVVGNRLVRFCCKGCVKQFDANPQAYLAKLPAMTDKHAGHEGKHEGDEDKHGKHEGHEKKKDKHEGHDGHEHKHD